MSEHDCVYCEHKDKGMFSAQCDPCTDGQNFVRRATHTELSRLRELVKEMREALFAIAGSPGIRRVRADLHDNARAAITKADALLAGMDTE